MIQKVDTSTSQLIKVAQICESRGKDDATVITLQQSLEQCGSDVSAASRTAARVRPTTYPCQSTPDEASTGGTADGEPRLAR